MPQKVFITFERNGLEDTAYSVMLASPDTPGFGIKNGETGEVVVPNNTPVNNPSIGQYEYDFTPDDNIVYIVSWQVVANQGDNPQYVTQQIGPFGPNFEVANYQAVADHGGVFVIGQIGTLQIRVSNLDGTPVNPEVITVCVRNPSNDALILSETPEKIQDGFFIYEWNITANIAPIKYAVTWSYTIDGTVYNELQSIVVSEDPCGTIIYTGRVLDTIKTLEAYLYACQNIPVYFEQAKPSDNLKLYSFTHPQWNQCRQTRIYRNKKVIKGDLEINYFKGEVLFNLKQTKYDFIAADYSFKWFTYDDLFTFLVIAVNVLNSYPPMSPNYNLNNVPDRWLSAVVYQAAVDALRQMLLSLQFQEPQQVFGSEEAAQKAFSNFETLKKNYEDQATKIFDLKKYGPYPQIQVIAVPEYTLPGGRSRWFRYLFQSGSSS